MIGGRVLRENQEALPGRYRVRPSRRREGVKGWERIVCGVDSWFADEALFVFRSLKGKVLLCCVFVVCWLSWGC